ncbi:hypothetical protein BGX28_010256 [Mortierella sp. GBA30]|nr:hypothetical protein BGX28_010256 [Mortierella sp. GBA30]
MSAALLYQKRGHVVLLRQIETNDPIDINARMAAHAGTATIKTIRRVIKLINELLLHGQKAMTLFISSATLEDLHNFKDAIFNKHQYSTMEEAIEQAAKKRLQKLGDSKNSSSRGNNNSRSGDLLPTTEVISGQEEEEQNEAFELTRNGGDREGETDDSGTKGDYGGFFQSMLLYFRSARLTIRYNKNINNLINSIRSLYLQGNPLHECDFIVLGQGLRSSIVHTLGVTLAVQVCRYFVDTAAQMNTSLPQSPVGDGFIVLSEADLVLQIR